MIGAIPTLQEHAFPVAYVILCVRFACCVRSWIVVFRLRGEDYASPILRHGRNTRYGGLARPDSTGTSTL